MKAVLLSLLLLASTLSLAQIPPYDRGDWPHWRDADADCQDSRQEVLIAESVTPVELGEHGCRVVAGTWVDPFSGQTITDPRALDVDHVVPLRWAHQHGAHAWTRERRVAFANELGQSWHLLAVSARLNRQKGARGPGEWMPPDERYHCNYARAWVLITWQWRLVLAGDDEAATRAALSRCKGSD